jgi:transposase
MARRAHPAISEDRQILQQRLRRERDPERKRRLHMLLLLSSDPSPSLKHVAEHLAVSRTTIARWLSSYQSGGIERLLTDRQRGPKRGQRMLSEQVLTALETRVAEANGAGSYVELQRWLEAEFGIRVNYKSLYDLVHYRLRGGQRVYRRHTRRRKPNSSKAPSEAP